MDQGERRKRITELARSERGRRKRQTFLHGLSSAVGYTVRADQLLNLEATDGVRSCLSAGYAAAVAGKESSKRVFFSKTNSIVALKLAESLARPLSEERVFLWLKQSEDCGAVSMTAGHVLRACEAIRAFDGDAVSMLSEDQDRGFILDKNPDELLETFEVSVWGSAWFEAARRFVQW